MTDKLPTPRTSQVPAPYAGGSYPALAPVAYEESRQPSILAQVRDMLARRRWSVVLGFVSVVGIAVFLSSRIPPLYTSTVTILVGIGPRNPDLPTLDMMNQLSLPSDVDTDMQLLESRRITEPVVDEYDLHVSLERPQGERPADVLQDFEASRDALPGTYLIASGGGGKIEVRRTEPDSLIGVFAPGQRVSTGGLAFTLPALEEDVVIEVDWFDSAVYSVMGRVGVGLIDIDASVIQLTCSAYIPKEAQLTCAGISESYVALRNELQQSDAVQSAEFLRAQSDSVKVQLGKAEEELRSYKERNDVVSPEVQASQEIQQLAKIQSERDQLEAERMALAGFMGEVRREGASSASYRQLAAFPTFIGNPMVGNILQNLIEYENQLHALSQRRTDQSPDVMALKQRIGDLEGQLGMMAKNYESALARQVGSLSQTVGRSQGRLSSVPEKQLGVMRLERRSDLLSELYTQLQQRLQEAEIAKGVELADVSVIDAATLPLGPSSPDTRMHLMLGILAGLLFGLGAALVQEFADTRLRRRDDVERETGLPVLTMVPSVKQGGLIAGRERRLLKKRGGTRAGLPLADYYPVGGDSVVEAFGSLGTDLGFMAGGAHSASTRTVVFTSASRGEGKTFSAVNFAATRTLQGYRTLLIDADLRAGSAGSLLGLNGGAGLSEVLAGEARLLDAVRMVKVGAHRMAVLGTGALQAGPGKLLDAALLDEILSTAADNFEQVVIDTPPLNLVGDAALFAARADAVVLVVRSGRTDREAVDMALSRLSRLGAKMIGVVLNDVEMPEKEPRYSYATAESENA